MRRVLIFTVLALCTLAGCGKVERAPADDETRELIEAFRDGEKPHRIRVLAIEKLAATRSREAIDALIDTMKDGDPFADYAMHLLRDIGEPAVEPLIAALKLGDEHCCCLAALALGGIGDTRAILPLARALGDEREVVRRCAGHGLVEFGEAVIEPLVDVLGGGSAQARACAAWTIGRMVNQRVLDSLREDEKGNWRDCAARVLSEESKKKAIGALAAALQDKDADVRRCAAGALGQIMDVGAAEPLIGCLRDKDEAVRAAAAFALANTGGDGIVVPLIEALGDESSRVRYAAAEALGDNHAEVAVGPLITALRDTDDDVRDRARWSLACIGEPAILPLFDVLRDEKDEKVRFTCERTLERMGKEVVPHLKEALQDREEKLRASAARTMGWIGGEEVFEPLVRALKDESGPVREAAAWAFENKPDARAMGPLLEMLDDRHSWAREGAVWALAKIGKPAIAPLMKALRSSDRLESIAASRALGEMKEKSAVEPLIEMLNDADTEIWKRCAYALKELTEQDFGVDYRQWKDWYEKSREK